MPRLTDEPTDHTLAVLKQIEAGVLAPEGPDGSARARGRKGPERASR